MSWATVKGEGNGKFDFIFKFKDGERHKVRILANDCVSVWVHSVPSANKLMEDNTPKTIRPYRTYLCNFDGHGRDCVSGLCDVKDPLWNMLKDDDKYDKTDGKIDRNKPRSFRKTLQHIIPIWNYEANRVEILRQGNSLFKQLADIIDVRGSLNTSDVMVWKTGKGVFNTEYHATPLDQSAFPLTDEINKQLDDLVSFIKNDMFSFSKDEMMLFLSGKAPTAPTNRQVEVVETKSLPEPVVATKQVSIDNLVSEISTLKNTNPNVEDRAIIEIIEREVGSPDVRNASEAQLSNIITALRDLSK